MYGQVQDNHINIIDTETNVTYPRASARANTLVSSLGHTSPLKARSLTGASSPTEEAVMVEEAVEAATAGAEAPSGKTLTREWEGDVVDDDAAHPQQHQAQPSPQPCQQQPSNLIITNNKQCKSIKAPGIGLVAYENKPLKFKPQPIIPPTEKHSNSITGNNITTDSNTKGKVNKPDIQG